MTFADRSSAFGMCAHVIKGVERVRSRRGAAYDPQARHASYRGLETEEAPSLSGAVCYWGTESVASRMAFSPTLASSENPVR